MKSEGIDSRFRSELMSRTERSATKVKLQVRVETTGRVSKETDSLIAASNRIVRLFLAPLARTQTFFETRGFMKALIGTEDQILSFMAFGSNVSVMRSLGQMDRPPNSPFSSISGTSFRLPSAVESWIFFFVRSDSLNLPFSDTIPRNRNYRSI